MTATLVVTTIQSPNAAMLALAEQAATKGVRFVVLGDRKSPENYVLRGADYLSLASQHSRFGAFSKLLPEGHYVRKNLGYLWSLEAGTDWIVETDDDNYPLANFLDEPTARIRARRIQSNRSWVNVYSYFSPDAPVWPRGFPLECLSGDLSASDPVEMVEESPVLVQGLAQANPDVDAVFRLTRPLPLHFSAEAEPLTLARGQWCPFNSQNTWLRRDIAVLAYLPSHCTFRMTDIWRSFVAQRCLWETDQRVVFQAPTVRQERNEHNLLRDFSDEIPGYLQNARIAKTLESCRLSGDHFRNVIVCYEALIHEGFVPDAEKALVAGWVREVELRIS